MFVRREFHDLHTGDTFSFVQGGPVHIVDDGGYIDTHQADPNFHDRLIMYRADDGLHGRLANHDPVWLITD